MAEITNQLLKDAIADAEAVRQTAIANAKIALEETFTPQIKSMLARRLRAEAMEDEGTMKDEGKAKEEPFQDAKPVGNAKAPDDTSTIGKGDNKEPSPASHGSSDIDQGGEGHGDSKKDWYDDWSESDFDLDEVIKELEEDILSEKKEEEEDEEEELDETKKEDGEEELDENWEEEDEGKKEEEGEEDEEEGEEDEGKIVDPTADAHTPPAAGMKHTAAIQKKGTDKPAAAAVAPMGKEEEDEVVTDPSKWAHPHGGVTPEAVTGHEEEGEEEELDLEAIIRELQADGHHKEEEDETSTMAHKMEALQNELAEYRKAVNLLRGKLQEVNLLNAKLLFTNKLFRNDRLTNEQKVAIVENFDRATTVREVKIVYTTLVETLNSTAKTLNKSKTAKVVTEGMASKPTKSTAPKKEILEENTVATRLQQLAGIL